MTRKPFKSQRKADDLAEFTEKRDWDEQTETPLLKRKLPVDSVETAEYVEAVPLPQKRGLHRHTQRIQEPFNNYGDIIRWGSSKQIQRKRAKLERKNRHRPLSRSEKVYWGKMRNLDTKIVAKLRDMRQYQQHNALKKLHYLLVEQKETKNYPYRELYEFVREKFMKLNKRRF